jgi:hypothetical protein
MDGRQRFRGEGEGARRMRWIMRNCVTRRPPHPTLSPILPPRSSGEIVHLIDREKMGERGHVLSWVRAGRCRPLLLMPIMASGALGWDSHGGHFGTICCQSRAQRASFG